MRICVVGGGGFVGHHMAVKFCADGHDVLIADHLAVNNHVNLLENRNGHWTKRYLEFCKQRSQMWNNAGAEFAYVDAADYHSLSRRVAPWKPDVLIHLAAVAHITVTRSDEYLAFRNSIITLKNSLDVAHACEAQRFVYFSSSTVYGNFKTASVDENSDVAPDTTYGAYKLAGELFVKSATRDKGISHTIIRPQALYGPRCVSRRVTQIFIENALDKKPLRIDGDGSAAHDFTHIDDLVDGVSAVLGNLPASMNETFCITAGQARTLRELAEIVQKRISCEVIYGPPDPEKPSRGTMLCTKAERLLGWKPKINLEDGMNRTIDFYEQFLNGNS